jgi:hypothetical protein
MCTAQIERGVAARLFWPLSRIKRVAALMQNIPSSYTHTHGHLSNHNFDKFRSVINYALGMPINFEANKKGSRGVCASGLLF